MHRLVWIALLGAGVLASGCGSSSKGPFANANWMARCPDDPPDGSLCSQDGPSHRVNAFDGEENVFVSCRVEKFDEDTFTMRFQVEDGQDELSVRNVRFTAGGTVQRCEVTVEDRGNRFVASPQDDGPNECGSNTPSDTQPCQLTNLQIDQEADPRPKIRGNLLCRNIESPNNPLTNQRDITSVDDETQPAQFELDGCDGNVL